jgi:hypothetical protein
MSDRTITARFARPEPRSCGIICKPKPFRRRSGHEPLRTVKRQRARNSARMRGSGSAWNILLCGRVHRHSTRGQPPRRSRRLQKYTPGHGGRQGGSPPSPMGGRWAHLKFCDVSNVDCIILVRGRTLGPFGAAVERAPGGRACYRPATSIFNRLPDMLQALARSCYALDETFSCRSALT